MGMRLIAGAVLLSLGIFTFALCYLEARNPKPPFWAKDTIMDSFLVPLIVSCITTGPMLVIQVLAMHYTEITSKDILLSLGVLIAGIVCTYMLRIPRRLAKYQTLLTPPTAAVPQ